MSDENEDEDEIKQEEESGVDSQTDNSSPPELTVSLESYEPDLSKLENLND